ncbi:MAG: hypothetical protein K2Q18_12730 [Bdellovibrionales bacterium]|nr:hypothetical protein [Bdellovibrionales bacterium]
MSYFLLPIFFILSISQTLSAETLTQIEASEFCISNLEKNVAPMVRDLNTPELKVLKVRCLAQAKKYKFQPELSTACEDIFNFSSKSDLIALDRVINCRDYIANAQVSPNSLKFCNDKFDSYKGGPGVTIYDIAFTERLECLKGISANNKKSVGFDFSQCTMKNDIITCNGKKYTNKTESPTPCSAVNNTSTEVEKKTDALVEPVKTIVK